MNNLTFRTWQPTHINYDGIIELAVSFLAALLLFAGTYLPRFMPQYSELLSMISLSLLVVAFAYTYSEIMQFSKKYISVILISLTGIAGLLLQEIYSQAGSIRYLAFVCIAAIFASFIIEIYKRNTYEFLASFFTNVTGSALVLGAPLYLSASKLMESSDLLLFALSLLACVNALKAIELDATLNAIFTFAFISLVAIIMFATMNRLPIHYAFAITLSIIVAQILLDYTFEGVNLHTYQSKIAFALIPAFIQGILLFVTASLFMMY
ncbi:MAG: hypothetical protein LBL41_02550 [Bifidobacteriaceae bacterium]|nr:hypothetical protein [Bifidobacteriaceae bacterium]